MTDSLTPIDWVKIVENLASTLIMQSLSKYMDKKNSQFKFTSSNLSTYVSHPSLKWRL